MNINEKIYQLRKAKGYSQEELADLLGVTRQAVSKWELGTSTPELESVVELAKLFQVTTDYLLTDAPQSQPTQETPAWLNRLPGSIGSLVRRFGWLAGVYVSVSGCAIAGIGALVRFSVKRLFGFSSFGDPYLDMEFQNFYQNSPLVQNNPILAISGVVITIGVILVIAGIILAILLKRKGQRK